MPVINLPRDTRGSEIGAALAGATKSITDAYMQQRTAEGVAEIMGNPQISEASKPVEILKKFGDPGYELFKKMSTAELIGAQVKNVLADAGRTSILAQLEQLKMPTAGAQAQADLAKTQQQTNLIGEQAAQTKAMTPVEVALGGARAADVASQTQTRGALLPGQIEAQGADIARTRSQTQVEQELLPDRKLLTQSQAAQALGNAQIDQARIPGIQAETELKKLQAEQAKRMMDAQQQFMQGGETFDQLIQKFGIQPGSPRAEAAKQGFLAKGWEGFQAEVDKGIAANEKLAEPKPLTTEQQRSVTSGVRQAESLERFVEAFDKSTKSKFGAVPMNLATLKQFGERYGWGTNDPDFVATMNATTQSVADQVQASGGQFISGPTIKLAKDVVPNLQGSALHAMMAANESASRKLETLKAERDMMLPGQPRVAVDQAIQRFEKLAADTKLTSYTSTPWEVEVKGPDGQTFTRRVNVTNSPDPPAPGTQVEGGTVVRPLREDRAGPQTTLIYKGNVVDPRNFAVVVDQTGTYSYGPQKEQSISGRELIATGQQLGINPKALLDQLKAQSAAGRR